MTAPTLPPELLPWADALGVFDVELAIALGPVVRTLESLLGARTDTTTTTGERDGWSGLTRHGDPDRLLVSEWLLADEFPDEFLRRAVSSELVHLDPAYRDDTPRGRLACVVDVGPDQLGAGRLVQLAAMVVLTRRAAAMGTGLVVGLMSGATISWTEGPFDVVTRLWLRSRSLQIPDPAAVLESLDAIGRSGDDGPAGHPDEVWLMCGPELAAHLRGRPRTVVTEPGDWDDDGVRTVRIRVEHRVATVDLPPAPVAVRALRGGAFASADHRSRAPQAGRPATPGPAGMRWPGFPGSGRRLVARGADDRSVVTLAVDPHQPARPRSHGFPVPVLAAGTAGSRLIVLLDRGADLEVFVVGRPLEGLHGLRIPRPDGVTTDVDGPLDPLALHSRELFWRRDGLTWLITPEGIAVADTVVAIGWSSESSTPRVLRSDAWPQDVPPVARTATGILLGLHRRVAWTHDGQTWIVADRSTPTATTLSDGEHPLGLAVVGGRTGLVTESASATTVRFRSGDTTRTFTRLSGAGAATHRALHPTRPWLAIARDTGTYVVDLDTDEVVARVVAT